MNIKGANFNLNDYLKIACNVLQAGEVWDFLPKYSI